MDYAICSVPAAPLRKEPAHRSEMVSQLLFGETMQVMEIKDEWIRIKTIYDDYEGWLTHHLVSEVAKEIALQSLQYVAVEPLNEASGPDGAMKITSASHLVSYDPKKPYLWSEDYRYSGSVKEVSEAFTSASIIAFARKWLNAPYLWGGKTILGVDCSGFVQTVFKLFGVKLKRDAWQQAQQGETITSLSSAKEADLAFFQNEEGRIVHVGIVMEYQQIIHAAGKVRIDGLTSEGIINKDTGKRSHRLHSIRRVI
jgi:cell wall-associated NlpC family hydrolase